jgi:tetratricopeptide (TPR) repeat protein
MLRGGLRTKDGKMIAAVMGIAAIIIGGCIFTGYVQNEQFLEQAVIAENYLKAGNYDQAAEAFEKALSAKGDDEELLTIGLADAFVGMNNYDKALEVLRSCYQKTSGRKVKVKIEEVISAKTDYEYSQSISRAEVYFTNREYNKAIEVFEQAKKIKSKDPTTYQRIAEAYIRLDEYELALEEVTEGQVFTQDESLGLTLAVVNSYLNQEQYITLLESASGYILQENYEDGIAKYKEAIELMPRNSEAYEELAWFYLNNKEYDKALVLLQNAIELTRSDELTDLLSQATQQKDRKDQIRNILSSLSKALINRNTTAVTAIMNTAFFREVVAADAPVYYNSSREEEINGQWMVIYDSHNAYYGEIRDNIREGSGFYFLLTDGDPEPGYYYYNGDWKNDLPNGTGETMEMKVVTNSEGQSYISKTLTEGCFLDAAENGRMIKYFYDQGEVTRQLNYTAKAGVPVPLAGESDLAIPTPQLDRYVIGILWIGDEQSKEYYRVEAQTIWGVKPFIGNTNK